LDAFWYKIEWSTLPKQIVQGVAIGFADFIFSTTCQKICMLAGIKFRESIDEGDLLSHEIFDKGFKTMTVGAPIIEEMIFRGVLQPLLTTALTRFLPLHATASPNNLPLIGRLAQALKLPVPKIISSIVLGSLFGSLHYFNYEKGGAVVSIVCAVGGSVYGIAKERHGLQCAIVAHITHNFMLGLLDKHYPAFLDD
jgi:membrane protease YdiL (CAAX protease family)